MIWTETKFYPIIRTVTIKGTKETGLKGHLNAGLSSRGGGWGFSLATMNAAPGYFHRK